MIASHKSLAISLRLENEATVKQPGPPEPGASSGSSSAMLWSIMPTGIGVPSLESFLFLVDEPEDPDAPAPLSSFVFVSVRIFLFEKTGSFYLCSLSLK